MHIVAKSTLLLVLALALAPVAHATQALAISRCATSDGIAAYTDGSCGAIGARSATMSLSLVRKLARAGGAPSEESSPLAFEAQAGIGAPAGAHLAALAGCPRTAGQLQVAFQQSVASGDVNQLAAIYDWTGVSGRQSRELLRRLERMSHSRVEDVTLSGALRRRAGCLLLSL
jgi:hypothetical protein